MSSPRKIRIGVVGCGVVATAYYLPHLRQHARAELVAVCDLLKERTDACQRLFGAREGYQDYHAMLRQADLDAVFILTGPGSHVPFTLAALAAGKHVLLQKPMALDLDGALQIRDATRKSGLKVLVEPSDHSPLHPGYAELRRLVRAGVLGDPYWFTLMPKGPESWHPSLGGNPYGEGAFYTKDSGGILFDFPYAPNQIVSVLGSCKSVLGSAKNCAPNRSIVPPEHYNAYLQAATDPDACNYWEVVVDQPRTLAIRNEAPDNVFSVYEMSNGFTGVFHTPRLFLPTLKGTSYGEFQIFGTEGNIVFGAGYQASVISRHRHLLPQVDEDGWYHLPNTVDWSKAKWPIPPKDAFNYYHASTDHLLDCILNNQEPVPNVDWGAHVTEMMYGAMESARTGRRYDMTTTLDW
jgi:predicted dehydrogenase